MYWRATHISFEQIRLVTELNKDWEKFWLIYLCLESRIPIYFVKIRLPEFLCNEFLIRMYRLLLFGFLYKFDVCMIEKTSVLFICIYYIRAKSIVFAVFIKFCVESGLATFSFYSYILAVRQTMCKLYFLQYGDELQNSIAYNCYLHSGIHDYRISLMLLKYKNRKVRWSQISWGL